MTKTSREMTNGNRKGNTQKRKQEWEKETRIYITPKKKYTM